MFGSVTRQKVCHPLAPSVTAEYSSSVPWDCMRGISSRATNGKVTNVVIRIIFAVPGIILATTFVTFPLAGHERKGDERRRQDDARHGEDDPDVVLDQPRPEPA